MRIAKQKAVFLLRNDAKELSQKTHRGLGDVNEVARCLRIDEDRGLSVNGLYALMKRLNMNRRR